ncbi:Hydroxymethylglutaryl-CoA synthase, cytoplasmic [Lamellibrachia satsuma]|nr:Hydroxymethylglutaryl-CoA synthase, cytoplasmic [Lamellibrachia satsuma]
MQHVYDFYKPDLSSEYPYVDGKLSIQCYLGALDQCYKYYCERANTKQQNEAGSPAVFSIDSADAVIFHSPFCKLVQKSVARLLLNDFLKEANPETKEKYSGLDGFRNVKLEDTYFSKDVEKAFMAASKTVFETKTKPTLLIANQVGNMYAPSVYSGLASFIATNTLSSVAGKRVVLFSYGSGLASSMFSLRVSEDTAPGSDLDKLVSSLADLKTRLESRKRVDPSDFEKIMKLREDTHHLAPYTPVGSIDDIFPGTWYVTHIDEMHRRTYERKPLRQPGHEAGNDVPVADAQNLKAASASQQMAAINSSSSLPFGTIYVAFSGEIRNAVGVGSFEIHQQQAGFVRWSRWRCRK